MSLVKPSSAKMQLPLEEIACSRLAQNIRDDFLARSPKPRKQVPRAGRKAVKADSAGLLRRYPVTVSWFHHVGKEDRRGWEQAEYISTLLPSLVRYKQDSEGVPHLLQTWLQQVPLSVLESKTGLSRHTVLRARRGERIHPASTRRLRSMHIENISSPRNKPKLIVSLQN